MKKTLSNITVLVNSADIRKETRDGREYWVVPSKTLPKDIVMNGILYPESEVKKSYMSLENTAAPFGHPKVNGKHVPATNPYAINQSWIGAFNENVKYEDGRVTLDKVIDVMVANQTENGRAVLAAIEKKEPIHTSTGVFINHEELDAPVTNSSGKTYTKIAKDLFFDHDCFLIGGGAAATPDEGVGIFVNSNGDELDVINSTIEDSYDEDIEWAAKNLVDAMQRRENAGKSKSIIEKIMSLFKGDVSPEASGLNTNDDNEETEMSEVKKAEFDALAKKVDDLTANAKTMATDMGVLISDALKPVTEALTAITTNAKVAEEAERTTLVAKLTTNGVLAEGEDKEFSVNQLRTLVAKIKPGKAAPMVGGFAINLDDEAEIDNYDPNVEIDKAMGAK